MAAPAKSALPQHANKKPPLYGRGFWVPLGTSKESDDDLLSQARCLLSLARERFTVLFGMGRGGSTLLWSSDKGVGKEGDLDPAFGLSGWLSLFTLARDWKKVGLSLYRAFHTALLLKI